VFDQAIRRDPTNTKLLDGIREVWLVFRNYTNALPILDLQLKLQPGNVGALLYKGMANLELGNYKEAVPDFTALLSQTNLPIARLNRGIAYIRLADYANAKADLEALQKDFPTAAPIHLGLGDIAWEKKDINAAIRHYQLFLTNAPPGAIESSNVAWRLKELKKGYR
jgi:tetratricopeptide (TPR) repeat protein